MIRRVDRGLRDAALYFELYTACVWMIGMPVVQLISRAAENPSWVSNNYGNLTENCHDLWVAVLEKTVVDNDNDLQKLANRLRKRLNKRYAQVAMEYVTQKPLVMVLDLSATRGLR